MDEVRQITCELDILPRAHGSSLFTRGETQALVVTTLGTGDDEQMIDSLEGMSKERFTPADGEGTVCGAIIETDDKSGLANSIEMLRLGGCLRST